MNGKYNQSGLEDQKIHCTKPTIYKKPKEKYDSTASNNAENRAKAPKYNQDNYNLAASLSKFKRKKGQL